VKGDARLRREVIIKNREMDIGSTKGKAQRKAARQLAGEIKENTDSSMGEEKNTASSASITVEL